MTAGGPTVEYTPFILSFANGDGELTVVEAKGFSDPGERGASFIAAAKLLTGGTTAVLIHEVKMNKLCVPAGNFQVCCSYALLCDDVYRITAGSRSQAASTWGP